jgi:hypothetical protein
MFIDYTRECQEKISHLPADTFGYCVTDKYSECPFYCLIMNIGEHCEFLEKCPAYMLFQAKDFVQFATMAKTYCLSSNRRNCKRFQLRSGGQIPAQNMLPDGSMFKE